MMTAKEKAQAIIDASFKEVKQDLARKANAGQCCHLLPTGFICIVEGGGMGVMVGGASPR